MESNKSIQTFLRNFLPILLLISTGSLLNAQNTLCIHPNAVIRTHSNSSTAIFGSVVNDGSFGTLANTNRGSVYFSGSSLQTIQGDSSIQIDSLHINNGSNVQLNQELRVYRHTWFDNGILLTNRSDSNQYFLHFLDNSSHSGSNNSSFVDGAVRKTGDDAFQFPVGKDANIQQIAISAPGSAGDHFTAFYRPSDPTNFGMSTVMIDSNCGGSPVMVDISEKEFWYLERTNGSSNVQVNIRYDTYSGVNTPGQMLVTNWNGSKWASNGNGGNSGTASDGSITSGTGCGTAGTPAVVSDFGFFSFGATSLSALPVELIEFNVEWIGGNDVMLNWVTASEINNSHFIIERKTKTHDFKEIGRVDGQGNSTDINTYQFLDEDAEIGYNFYRLKQVDFDNSFAYSPIRKVRIEEMMSKPVLYPNPAHDIVHISINENGFADESSTIKLFDSRGRLIREYQPDLNSANYQFNINDLSRGVYTVTYGHFSWRLVKH